MNNKLTCTNRYDDVVILKTRPGPGPVRRASARHCDPDPPRRF